MFEFLKAEMESYIDYRDSNSNWPLERKYKGQRRGLQTFASPHPIVNAVIMPSNPSQK